jgi:molybdopterin converting factor small subunit
VAVTVRLVGDLRRFAEHDIVEFEAGAPDGCSLGTAVAELIRRNPRVADEVFDEQGRLRYTSLLILNGRSAAWPQDKDRPIEDGAEVILTRFYSGG